MTCICRTIAAGCPATEHDYDPIPPDPHCKLCGNGTFGADVCGVCRRDRQLGAALRALYEEWMEDAYDGILPGSAADQCSDLYGVLNRHGLKVR